MSNAIVQHTVDELWRIAQFISKPGMFGVKSADQAMALMLVAQAEGRHPATVAMEYDIIQGRPALRAKAKMARFQQAGGVVNWLERTDRVAAAEFSHPTASPKPLLVRWDMERAKAALLTGKDNWKKYPAQMLSARVISEGVDAVYPACAGGFYVQEEVQDFEEVVKPARATARSAPKHEPAPEQPALAAPRQVPVPDVDHKFMVRGDAFDTEHKTIAEMDDGELEYILRTARTTLDDSSMAHAHDYAHAAIRMVKAERESRKQGAALSPAPEAGAEATQAAPAAAEPAPEAPVALPEVEADVLTAKTLILCGRVAGKPHKKCVKDMDSNERQIAYDEAQMALSDPDPKKRAHAMGVLNLLEANK